MRQFAILLFSTALLSTAAYGADSAEKLLQQADEQVKAGDDDGALKTVNKAIALSPSPLCLQRRAEILLFLHRSKEAAADCEHCIKLSPADGELYRLEGRIYVQQKRYDDALVAFNNAIKFTKSKNRVIKMDRAHLYEVIFDRPIRF